MIATAGTSRQSGRGASRIRGRAGVDTWLASRPEPGDWPDAEHGTGWARAGDAAAAADGAPLVSAGDGILELFSGGLSLGSWRPGGG